MLVSIVVCTYNRADILTGCLTSLAEQTLDRSKYEVIIVDNNSTDQTFEVANHFVQKYHNFLYIKEIEQGLSHARNRGYKEARGNYIGYIDSDAKADSHWLKYAFQVIEEICPDIFGGPYYPFYQVEKPKWMKDEYEACFFEKSRFLTDNEYLSGTNIFFKRTLFQELGGFDSELGMKGNEISYGEETALILKARKIKAKIYYCHDMKVYHLVPEYKMTPFWYLLRNFENGRRANKIFHLTPEIDKGELALYLLNQVKAMFVEIQKSIFAHKTSGVYLENLIKENVSPIANQIGRAYEGYLSEISQYAGNEIDKILDYLRDLDYIRKKEKEIEEIKTSKTFRAVRILAFPFRQIASLKSKVKRKI